MAKLNERMKQILVLFPNLPFDFATIERVLQEKFPGAFERFSALPDKTKIKTIEDMITFLQNGWCESAAEGFLLNYIEAVTGKGEREVYRMVHEIGGR